jgi:plasmid maintenance system antidote protein VapI
MIESPNIRAMKTVNEIRLSNARALSKSGPAEFARTIESTTQQVNQFMGPNPTRNIGNAIARRIEKAFDKPTGWLDIEHEGDQSEKAEKLHDEPTGWASLDDAGRAQVEAFIKGLLSRPPQPPTQDDDDRPLGD